MLTGRFQYVPPKTRLRGKPCLVVDLDGDKQLRYSDDRVMGKIYLLGVEDLAPSPQLD